MHILLAVDGSKGSQGAVRVVAQTPFPEDTQVTLLHVINHYLPREGVLSNDMITNLRQEEERAAHQLLDAARDQLAPRGFEIHQRYAEGIPAQEVVEAAEALNTDLIILGALGLSGWMRVLLGSVPLTVVKHAPCPVWSVKKPIKTTRMDVLVASDGSENARHAIHTLRHTPFPQGTVCHLLHVLPSANEHLNLSGGETDPAVLASVYKMGEQHRQHSEQLLKTDAETLTPHFAEVRPFTLEGDPRRQILAAAHEVEADLVVMGHKGMSAIEEFFLGSISHKVLKHCHASVLITPLITE